MHGSGGTSAGLDMNCYEIIYRSDGTRISDQFEGETPEIALRVFRKVYGAKEVIKIELLEDHG